MVRQEIFSFLKGERTEKEKFPRPKTKFTHTDTHTEKPTHESLLLSKEEKPPTLTFPTA